MSDDDDGEEDATFEHRSNIELSAHVKTKLRHASTPSSDDVFFSSVDSPILRRDNTFTTYQIQTKPSCLECQRREKLLREKHQRVLHLEEEDRKLTDQLRSTVLLTSRYQEENYQLKNHLHRLNAQLREYQNREEKTTRTTTTTDADHLRRLRHEVYVYNQVLAGKRHANY